MKWIVYTPLALPFAALISCGSMNQAISGDFDPLAKPGLMNKQESPVVSNYSFKSGQYVTAASNSTAFFSQRPTGNAVAESLLAAGTAMRVVNSEGSFVKVELEDGKVGYVASAMLNDSGVAPTSSDAVQVYPPIGGGDALPLSGNPGDLPPAITPLPLMDATTGAPIPPIEPPTIPDLPPAGAPATNLTELPPAAPTAEVPTAPTGSAEMKKPELPAAEGALKNAEEKVEETKEGAVKEAVEKAKEAAELPEPAKDATPPPPPPVEAPKIAE